MLFSLATVEKDEQKAFFNHWRYLLPVNDQKIVNQRVTLCVEASDCQFGYYGQNVNHLYLSAL